MPWFVNSSKSCWTANKAPLSASVTRGRFAFIEIAADCYAEPEVVLPRLRTKDQAMEIEKTMGEIGADARLEQYLPLSIVRAQ
jgi:hypothetical protein